MEHDYGFAPNPFWGTLTLATCKAIIRKNHSLAVGDWIVGLGSKAMDNEGKVVYVAQVDEVITFDDYWNNPHFQVKKANIKGSLLQMYGDNVYHTVEGKMVQEPCAHSNDPNGKHKNRDVSGKNVLLCKRYFYFGDKAIILPKEFEYIGDTGNPRATRYKDLDYIKINSFITWLEANYDPGIHGDPCNWKEFKIPKMPIYEEEEDE
jgi:hypothetical protein